LEYALAIGVVVVAVIVAFQNTPVGDIVSGAFEQIETLIA
jgi:hypothetical protein